VLDTNVLVSGLLSPAGPPGVLLNAISSGGLTPVYSDPVFEEYAEVLLRPSLRLDPRPVLELLLLLGQVGAHVMPSRDILDPLPAGAFPDIDDRPFYAAALAAGCQLVTGNLRHYPKRGPVEVLAPARAVERLASVR
jgi:putative PIN family toxin of toxin-antitoxin system